MTIIIFMWRVAGLWSPCFVFMVPLPIKNSFLERGVSYLHYFINKPFYLTLSYVLYVDQTKITPKAPHIPCQSIKKK